MRSPAAPSNDRTAIANALINNRRSRRSGRETCIDESPIPKRMSEGRDKAGRPVRDRGSVSMPGVDERFGRRRFHTLSSTIFDTSSFRRESTAAVCGSTVRYISSA